MTKIRILMLTAAAMLLTQPAVAKHRGRVPLDKVAFTAQTEMWVKTDDAKVTIDVNASLNNQSLAAMRTSLLKNINSIAAADWHITRFDRQQSSSGLENVLVQAEARVPEAKLTNLRENAKKVTKPGETYVVSNIDFTPSLAAVEAVKKQAREVIYQQVNQEIATLNKDFAPQKYTVKFIGFDLSGYARAERSNDKMMMMAARSAAPAFQVSQKVSVQARVMLASDRAMPKCQQDQGQ